MFLPLAVLVPSGLHRKDAIVCVTVLPAGVSVLVTASEGNSVISLATIPLPPLSLSHRVLVHRPDDFLLRHVQVHIRTEPGC